MQWLQHFRLLEVSPSSKPPFFQVLFRVHPLVDKHSNGKCTRIEKVFSIENDAFPASHVSDSWRVGSQGFFRSPHCSQKTNLKVGMSSMILSKAAASASDCAPLMTRKSVNIPCWTHPRLAS